MIKILVYIISVIFFLSVSFAIAREPDFETANKINQEALIDGLNRILDPGVSFPDEVNDSLIVGPSFFSAFSKNEDLAKIGIPTVFNIMTDEKQEPIKLDGRSYRGEDIRLFFETGDVRNMLKYFSEGHVRHARKMERGVVASFLPFELDPTALVVLEADDAAMVFYLHEKKLSFIDLISEYTEKTLDVKSPIERALAPTDLVSFHLLDDNDTYLENIRYEDMQEYTNSIISEVKTFFKEYEKDGFDLNVEITLLKNKNADIQVGTRPAVDNQIPTELMDELMQIKSPRTKKGPISWRVLFQVNNGSDSENQPEK
ncbi:MAG: hypothetical protein WCX65_08565 [bacterium]